MIRESIGQIYSLWSDVDDFLGAGNEASTAEAAPREVRQGINSCGYFLLLFAQVEQLVNKAYTDTTGHHWQDAAFSHRVWMLEPLLPVDLVDDLLEDYEVRCEVAHGHQYQGIPIAVSTNAARYPQVAKLLS